MLPFKGWIDFGGNQDTSFFAEPLNSSIIWATPVDGTVIRVLLNDDVTELSDTIVGTTEYTIDDLSDAIADIKVRNEVGWGRVRFNFVKAQITSPGVGDDILDWFDPLSQVINNLKLLGEVSAEAKMQGIFLVPAPFNPVTIWEYDSQPLKTQHTFAEYKTKVREAARTIGAAWLNANPNIQVMVAEGYTPYVDAGGTDESNPYGLYKVFLDELLDTFGEFLMEAKKAKSCNGECVPNNYLPKCRVIITDISSYSCVDIGCLEAAIQDTNGTSGAAYQGGSSYFDLVTDFGDALWITATPFDPFTPSANYFTPDLFANMLKGLVRRGVEWAWIFNDSYSFFNDTTPIPEEYIDALVLLREELRLI